MTGHTMNISSSKSESVNPKSNIKIGDIQLNNVEIVAENSQVCVYASKDELAKLEGVNLENCEIVVS